MQGIKVTAATIQMHGSTSSRCFLAFSLRSMIAWKSFPMSCASAWSPRGCLPAGSTVHREHGHIVTARTTHAISASRNFG